MQHIEIATAMQRCSQAGWRGGPVGCEPKRSFAAAAVGAGPRVPRGMRYAGIVGGAAGESTVMVAVSAMLSVGPNRRQRVDIGLPRHPRGVSAALRCCRGPRPAAAGSAALPTLPACTASAAAAPRWPAAAAGTCGAIGARQPALAAAAGAQPAQRMHGLCAPLRCALHGTDARCAAYHPPSPSVLALDSSLACMPWPGPRQVPVLQFRAVGVSFEGRQALIPHLQRGEWGRLGRLGRWAKVARGGAGTGVSAYPPMSRCLRVALPSPANPRCPG